VGTAVRTQKRLDRTLARRGWATGTAVTKADAASTVVMTNAARRRGPKNVGQMTVVMATAGLMTGGPIIAAIDRKPGSRERYVRHAAW